MALQRACQKFHHKGCRDRIPLCESPTIHLSFISSCSVRFSGQPVLFSSSDRHCILLVTLYLTIHPRHSPQRDKPHIVTMSTDTLKAIPWPTLDRPFGIELWPIFAKGYSKVMGYSPNDFRFAAGELPMSTLPQVATVLISYYIVVFGGRELMKRREPFVLKYPFLVHNLYLTIISGVLLALFIEQLLPIVARNGVFFAICNHKGGWTKELVMLYYVSTKVLQLCTNADSSS